MADITDELPTPNPSRKYATGAAQLYRERLAQEQGLKLRSRSLDLDERRIKLAEKAQAIEQGFAERKEAERLKMQEEAAEAIQELAGLDHEDDSFEDRLIALSGRLPLGVMDSRVGRMMEGLAAKRDRFREAEVDFTQKNGFSPIRGENGKVDWEGSIQEARRRRSQVNLPSGFEARSITVTPEGVAQVAATPIPDIRKELNTALTEGDVDAATAKRIEGLEPNDALRELAVERGKKAVALNDLKKATTYQRQLAGMATVASRQLSAAVPDSDAAKSAQAELEKILGAMNGLLSGGEAPTATPPQSGAKPMTADTARQFLKDAGGDKSKAREMARAAGYTF